MARQSILIVLALCLSACGGIFLAPPAPGRVCIFDLQGKIVPKDDCGCYVQTGAFTWKGYKLHACPSPKREARRG